MSAAERSRGAHGGGGGGAAGDAAGPDSNRPAASQAHIHPVRVSATGCAKFVDRGHPPELQLGGQIEPLIDGLIFHANARLIQEEHNLEAVSFADRGSHAQEHQIFVREVFRAFRLMESCNMEMGDLVALIRFLKAWCNTHIPKDRRFAPLMLEKTKG